MMQRKYYNFVALLIFSFTFKLLYFDCFFIIVSMSNQEKIFQPQYEEQYGLNYQNKKLLHTIQLQILDIQNTLHYIQKKHTMHQLKEALSQIYNIFNQTQPLFIRVKGLFLHQQMKKIMNCFGIIYVILMEHVERDKYNVNFQKDDEKKGFRQTQQLFKPVSVNQNVDKSEDKLKINPLGGIHLYNEHYIRHIENQSQNSKIKSSKKTVISSEVTRHELAKMINDEINDTSYVDSQPDQRLDIFSFKFRYGRQNQIITFHDELLSIANFFKQSQNQAFQFLNKTKQQTSIISYNDSFRDIVNQIKKEKQDKLIIFNDKMKAAFESIKSKTEKKMAQIQQKLHVIQQPKKVVLITKEDAASQTIFDIDQEIKELNRRIVDSQQRFKVMINFKKKQIEQSAMVTLELENEIELKNREIVYLKLNIQQNALVASNLTKKIKFLTDSNKKIKDIVRSHQETARMKQILQHKQDEQFFKDQKVNEMQLESIKKQRRMAKKILLHERNKSLIGQKTIYLKRFTQQLDSSTSKHLLSRKLSEIAESQLSQNHRKYQSDSHSLISNKNSTLQDPSLNRPIKKISILNNAQVTQSTPSIKSTQEFTKTKKTIKQKHSSQLEKHSRTSLFNKLASMMNEDSILDECSSSQRDFIDNQEIEAKGSNSYEWNKVQEMFKKQMNRNKNILTKQKIKKSSFFNKKERKTSHQKHESPSFKRSSSNILTSLISIRQAQNKNIEQTSQERMQRQSTQMQERQQQKKEKENLFVRQSAPRQLSLCPTLCHINIYNASPTIVDAGVQTQKNNQCSSLQDTQGQFYTNVPTYTTTTSNNFQFTHSKDKKTLNQHQLAELITRSATQSKINKIKHTKNFYTLNNKQNQKYVFPIPKNTQKSVDQTYNSPSRDQCEQQKTTIQPLSKKPSMIKKGTFYQPSEKNQQQKQLRKLAIKSKTLNQFKMRVTELHKPKCGNDCKHLQKFVQNYLKYKQQEKQKVKMAVKNMCDNINYTSVQSQQKNYFPIVQKKKH